MLKKSCVYSITLIFILYCSIFPVHANEVDQASTFAEMKQWIKDHKAIGGTLKLTDDIIIDETYYYNELGSKNDKDIVIDCGDHTIYVEGMADFTFLFYRVTFQGNNDIFHVKKNAHLAISQGILNSVHGNTIVQEEGSELIQYENRVNLDSIQYAKYPTIKSNSTYMQYHTYLQYELAEVSDFADELNVEIFYQGESYKGSLPVIWNMNELSGIEDLNRYYTMEGSFQGNLSSINDVLSPFDASDAILIKPPKATAIWTEDGISIEEIRKVPSEREDWLILEIDAPKGVEGYQVYLRENEDASWNLAHEINYDGLLVFQIFGNCQFYVQAIYEDYQLSSNIIIYNGQIFESVVFGGGNRGGGINILPEDDPSDPPLPNNENLVNSQPSIQEPKTISLDVLTNSLDSRTSITESDSKNQMNSNTLSKDNEKVQAVTSIKNNSGHKTSEKSMYQILIGMIFGLLIISGSIWMYRKKRL